MLQQARRERRVLSAMGALNECRKRSGTEADDLVYDVRCTMGGVRVSGFGVLGVGIKEALRYGCLWKIPSLLRFALMIFMRPLYPQHQHIRRWSY